MATNVAIARRRARLAGGFVPQVAAAVPPSEEHAIAEIRWFPVREPVSGNRYAMVRGKTRSELTGWGEGAQCSEQDARALGTGPRRVCAASRGRSAAKGKGCHRGDAVACSSLGGTA